MTISEGIKTIFKYCNICIIISFSEDKTIADKHSNCKNDIIINIISTKIGKVLFFNKVLKNLNKIRDKI